MAALAKSDKVLGVESVSECFKAEGSDPKKTSIKGGNSQVVATATSSQTKVGKPESSAPPRSTVMGSKKRTKPSKLPRGAQKMKETTTAEPQIKINKIAPPPIFANLIDAQLDSEHTGWFIDSFPSNIYSDSPDYSICDQDCGWCGRCMDDMTHE